MSKNARDILTQAVDAHRANRHGEAMLLYQRVLELDPKNTQAHNNLASIFFAMDRNREGFEHAKVAFTINPDDVDYIRAYGLGLFRIGDSANAEKLFLAVLAREKDDPIAMETLTQIFLDSARLQQVLNLLQPYHPDKWPRPEFLFQYAMALIGLQRYDEALSLVRDVQAKRPDDLVYLRVLGAILLQMSRYEEAVGIMRRTTELQPNEIGNWTNLCAACKGAYRFDEGIKAAQKALEMDPDSFDALSNIGVVYREKGEAETSIGYLKRAMELRPTQQNVHYNIGLSLVAAGYLREGWPETEWRWQTDMNRHLKRPESRPQWDGSDIGEAVLCLFADQGVGDTIQMARFLPIVRQRAPKAKIVLRCEPKLAPLLRAAYGDAVDDFIAQTGSLSQLDANPDFDYHHPLTALFSTLCLDIDDIDGAPYLKTSTPRAYRDHPGQKIIGLSWHTQSVNTGFKRSLKLHEFAFLKELGDVKIIDLQYGDTSAERAENAANGFAIHHDESVDAWADLQPFVDQVAGCDLVISIDNTTVHVAGALGVPVWTLVPFIPYWRWTMHKEQTPWYASMRFFQQSAPGQYGDVLARLKDDLGHWMAGDGAVLTPQAPYDYPVPPYHERQTKRLAALLNAPLATTSFEKQVSGRGLVAAIEAKDYDVLGISGVEIERMTILPPTLQEFDTELYASRWRLWNPSLVDKLTRADKVVLNGENLIAGTAPVTLKLLYLLYFAHRFCGKPIAILNHSCFPEGGLALSDPHIVAYYRKVYALCEDVAVRDPFSRDLLGQLKIPARLVQPALPVVNAKTREEHFVAVLLEGLSAHKQSELLEQIGGLLAPQGVSLALPFNTRDREGEAMAAQCVHAVKSIKTLAVKLHTESEMMDFVAQSAVVLTNQIPIIAIAQSLSKKILILPGALPDVEGYCEGQSLALATVEDISNIKGLAGPHFDNGIPDEPCVLPSF